MTFSNSHIILLVLAVLALAVVMVRSNERFQVPAGNWLHGKEFEWVKKPAWAIAADNQPENAGPALAQLHSTAAKPVLVSIANAASSGIGPSLL